MTDTQRFQQIAELFESARTRSGQDRETFLLDACTDDPDLLAEVRRLLTHHETDDAPLATPIVPEGLTIDMLPPPAAPPIPEQIGRYRVLRQLGIGGMGVVYLAEQDRPKRRVAVKVIRPGVLSRNLLKRFEFEAQALARLQHPGIAQIYEVGAFQDGPGQRPFFAMELIEGEPLLTHADQQQLDTRHRLELFLRVCDAVHHAHQRGVIHRDLKPANILIDATGQPKVLDFGVARATDADLQVTTLQTSTGQLIGTLPYMSPEQLAGREADVDVRSDVYALAVTLYEMLSGRLPYDLADTNLLSAARKIAETDPTALSAVRPAYRGDLNTIVLKALDKDPDRRYQAASALAADIRRFLENEPIVARPATAAYHIQKFARRHVALVAGAGVALLAVVGGSLGVGWQAARTNAEAHTRREVANFLHEMLTSVDPEKSGGRAPTVLDLLDGSSANLAARFERAPLVGAELAHTIGETYHALGQFDKAEPLLRRATESYRDTLGPADDHTLEATASLAYTLVERDRLEEAEALLGTVMPFAVRGRGGGARSVLVKHAIVLDELGRKDEAGELYERILAVNTERLGEDANDTINARMNLGSFLMERGRLEDALPHCEGAASAFRAKLGDDHPFTISAIANLGACCCKVGRVVEGAALLAEAAERSARVLGPTHLHTLRRLKNLAIAQWQLGDSDARGLTTAKLLRDCREALGDSHADTISALELHAAAVGLSGDLAGAESLALEWYERLRASAGAGHRSTVRVAVLLANVYEEMGRPDDQAAWRAVAEQADAETGGG